MRFVPDFHKLADFRRQERIRLSFARRRDGAVRLIPRVHRQREFSVVGGQHPFRPDIDGGLRGLLGEQMNLIPPLIVLPVFHDREIESAEPCAYIREVLSIAAVAAAKHAAIFCYERKRAPLGGILVEEASGKMLGRQDMNRKPANLRFSPQSAS